MYSACKLTIYNKKLWICFPYYRFIVNIYSLFIPVQSRLAPCKNICIKTLFSRTSCGVTYAMLLYFFFDKLGCNTDHHSRHPDFLFHAVLQWAALLLLQDISKKYPKIMLNHLWGGGEEKCTKARFDITATSCSLCYGTKECQTGLWSVQRAGLGESDQKLYILEGSDVKSTIMMTLKGILERTQDSGHWASNR